MDKDGVLETIEGSILEMLVAEEGKTSDEQPEIVVDVEMLGIAFNLSVAHPLFDDPRVKTIDPSQK